MKIDRNDPCPCGSGKKYKKCCMDKEEEKEMDEQHNDTFTPEDIMALSDSVFNKAFHFIKSSKYYDDLDRSREIFFDLGPDETLEPSHIQPIDHNNYMLWFMCDYVLENEGVTPLELFAERMAEYITEDERELALVLSKSSLALYEALSVDPQEQIATLWNLFTLQGYEVLEPRVVQVAREGLFFALRLAPWQNMVFSVGDMYVYPQDFKEHMLMFLKNKLVDPRAIVPRSLTELIKDKGYVFNHLQMMVRGTSPKSQLDDEEDDIDEEPEEEKSVEVEKEAVVSLARAHFMVEDFDKVKEKLDTMNLAKLNRFDDKGFEYDWSKTPARRLSGEIDGKIILTRRKLVFETRESHCLEDGKSDIRKALKPYVKYMYDDMEKRRILAGNK